MFITVEDVFSSCEVHCILYIIYKVQCDMFIISYMMVVFVLHCLILMTCLKSCADDWLEKLKLCAMMATAGLTPSWNILQNIHEGGHVGSQSQK